MKQTTMDKLKEELDNLEFKSYEEENVLEEVTKLSEIFGKGEINLIWSFITENFIAKEEVEKVVKTISELKIMKSYWLEPKRNEKIDELNLNLDKLLKPIKNEIY